MTTAVHTHPLISIRSDATVQNAARLMADCSIGALGVLGPRHEFCGLVTERDLSSFVAQGKDAGTTRIEEITNDFPIVVEGPLDDSEALDHMCKSRVRHLLVREGDDYRIVSMRDLVPRPEDEVLVRDAMSAPAVACRDEAFFEEIAEILAERDISGMPVVDPAGKVVGVVSERDLARAGGADGPLVRAPPQHTALA